MEVPALIPARGGSKGVPRKNVKLIGGHPLIAYSIAACKMSNKISDVYVSTDDREIASVALKYGAKVPFLRPLQYASDTSGDWEVINHFFENIDAKYVAYMRPTTPLREPKKIDKYVEFFLKNKENMTGMRSMHELAEPPYKMIKIEDGYCTGFFEEFEGNKNYTNLPRQMFPKAYHPNGYIDIAKRSYVINSKDAFGMEIMPVVTPHTNEIDTKSDIKMIQFEISSTPARKNKLLKYMNSKWSKLR
tara:strand:+ start:2066 stop:2806 length:741 start_codon:yes stop_codon:yes gene_type:complete